MIIKYLCKEFFYQVSVKMHNPITKGYYYKKDMKNLLALNILYSIENFKKKSNIFLNTKIKNYLFNEIFEFQIEKNIFKFEDRNIVKIMKEIIFYLY